MIIKNQSTNSIIDLLNLDQWFLNKNQYYTYLKYHFIINDQKFLLLKFLNNDQFQSQMTQELPM